MKLWQKILLISLIFVMGAVEATAFIVLSHDFSMTIERERERSVTEHNYLAAAISDQVAYLWLIGDRKDALTQEEIGSAIATVLNGGGVSADGAAVSLRGEYLWAYGMNGLDSLADFRAAAETGEGCLTVIAGEGARTRLFVASGLTLEGTRYQLYTAADMGEIYLDYDEQLLFVRNLGIVLAVSVSVVLMAIQISLVRPLSRVNTGLKEIADGNYSLRIEEKGGVEFRELAENINRMSEAVEENVGRISEIADSRKQFVDSLAHEMKTPLTSIMGFGDLMRITRDVSESKRREYAEIIVEEAKRLRTLSGKLLELATTGGAELELAPASLRDIFSEVHVTVAPVLVRQQMRMEISCPPVMINCDRELFKSLLYNLIDNAIKASKPGGTIILNAVSRDNRVRIAVIDFGIGMNSDQIKRVTEPFYMVDKSRSRKAGGAGLGLALCVEIVRRHNGLMKIESEPGKGTRVLVYMNCSDGQRPEEAEDEE